MNENQIGRLREEYEKGLRKCQDNIYKWKKFKEDYEALQQRLATLPDALSYDITVPFGNSAFVKGKLVHTNKIMVLLGDDWFAEVSAKQAMEIARRKIIHCDKMLENFEKEKLQFQNWLQYIGEVSGNKEFVEIVEEYDEEKEKLWAEQHAKNLKAFREKLARERKYSEGSNCTSETDEDYLDKLSKLQIGNEVEFGTIDCSDDGSHSEELHPKPTLKLNINGLGVRKTSESETGEEIETCSPKHNKHVRWMDLSKQNIKRITFKHSKPKKPNTPSSKPKMMHESSEDENHPLILSPSDIYTKFGNFFQSSPPKSILKVKSPSPSSTDLNGPVFPTCEPALKESSPETDESLNVAFTGEVREHSSPIQIVQSKSTRPVSHFKNSRKNRRR